MEAIPFPAGSHGLRMLTCGRSKPFLRPVHYFPLPRSPLYRSSPSSRLRYRPIVGSLEKGHDSHHHDDDHHDHDHNHHHQHDDHHHHHHHYCHAGSRKLNALQEAIIRFARVTGWASLADFLRENIWMCCSSLALLLFAAACPHILPSSSTKKLQNVLLAAAFPLVGVSAALDAANDIAGGKVNIHVLMALAAFASVFMGNSLEGGLLLAMFNLAHIAEDYFTSRAMVDVKELKENNPEFALLLDVKNGNPTNSSLTYKQVPVQELEVGSYILVRAGEAVPIDGEVFQGSSTVTVEHLTGESKPLEKKMGDCIPGGARNLDGMLIVKGILLKGGHVLDALASCHTVAFDKTGTLTTGELTCKAIEPIHGHSLVVDEAAGPSCCVPNCEEEALAVAAAMEKGTTHPIGRAVIDHSIGKDLPHVSVESFESLPGRGLLATLAGLKSDDKGRGLLKASLGSVEYVASLCKSKSESDRIKDAVSASIYGGDFVHAALSVNRKVTLFHFEDKPRPGVEKVVAALRDQARLRLMVLTGDHASSAWRVANSVGIEEVYSSLKPEDKLNRVKTFSRDTGSFA